MNVEFEDGVAASLFNGGFVEACGCGVVRFGVIRFQIEPICVFAGIDTFAVQFDCYLIRCKCDLFCDFTNPEVAGSFLEADFNQDGLVNIDDAGILAAN